MSSYDLVCEACGHEFEVFRQGFLKDDERICCPECSADNVHQKFSSFYAAWKGPDCSAPPAPTRRQCGCGHCH